MGFNSGFKGLSKSWKPFLHKLKERIQPPITQQSDLCHPMLHPDTSHISYLHQPLASMCSLLSNLLYSLTYAILCFTPTRAISLSHNSPWPPCGPLVSTTCPVTGPTPTLSPSFQPAQAIFEPNLFPYEYPLHFLNIVILHLSAYDDGTDRVFRNVGI